LLGIGISTTLSPAGTTEERSIPQPVRIEFLLVALEERQELRTVLDTSAMTSWRQLEGMLPDVDQFWIDLKIIDGERHRQVCGKENFPILENLRRLCPRKADVVVTFPVIPGYTDTKDNLRGVADVIAGLKPKPRLALLPHSESGHQRSERLGMAYPLTNVPPPSEKQLGQVRRYFERRRITVLDRSWQGHPA
jgi:pyruvate formate lyase activating enzyme